MKIKLSGVLALFGLALAVPAFVGPASARHVITEGHEVLMPAAQENRDFSEVTLPVYRGESGGQDVFYVVTDASTEEAAAQYGANFVPKLNNVDRSATQQVTVDSDGTIHFPATVDFSPRFFIDRGNFGDCAAVPFLPFGRRCFSPGAQAEPGYTPLIELPDGTVLDAPHVANDSGRGDKVRHLHIHHGDQVGEVVYEETTGLYEEHTIHYISFDASIPPAAALEGASLAPRLDEAGEPGESDVDPVGSTRASLAAFTNGRTGRHDPNRQGLNSAILDRTDPLNVIQAIPDDELPRVYSPLWDIHLATWRATIPNRDRTRQDDFEAILAEGLAGGRWTAPDGTTFRASDFVVNCPVVSTDGEGVFNIPD